MSDYERETRTSTPDGDATVRERTTVGDAAPERTVVVQRGGSAGAWLLAAVVAIIAIIAVVWMMNSRTAPTNDEISAAMDSSRAAGYVEGASTALSNVPPAPTVDTGSIIASQTAADAARAASEARAAAERAADSAQSAADNISANVTADTNATTP